MFNILPLARKQNQLIFVHIVNLLIYNRSKGFSSIIHPCIAVNFGYNKTILQSDRGEGIMLGSICHTLSAAIAWWLALSYIHIETPVALFHGLLSAALCGVGSFCLYTVGLTSLIPLVSLSVFLLTTLGVQAHRRGNCGDAVLAFLLAEGGYSFMAVAGTAALQHMGVWGMILACALPTLFFLLTHKLRKLFPPSDWREYYTGTAPEPGRIRLRLAHNYLIAAGVCAAMTAGIFAITPESIAEVLSLSLAGFGLYWSAMLLLILINAYKRERIAVLVEQQYRGEMQSFLNVIRSQRHDYNFHVQTIAGLIRENKLEECRKYVTALEEDFSKMNAVLRNPCIQRTGRPGSFGGGIGESLPAGLHHPARA